MGTAVFGFAPRYVFTGMESGALVVPRVLSSNAEVVVVAIVVEVVVVAVVVVAVVVVVTVV
jgi:hypothetical protein